MKRRALPIFLGLAVLLVSIIGGTYAWFFSKNTYLSGNGKAAKIELFECLGEKIIFDNILPGEPIDLGGSVIYYRGTRDAIIQFKLVGDGYLLPGSENTADWNNLDPLVRDEDYIWNTNRYQYTDKRMNAVLKLTQKPVKTPIGDYLLFYESSYEPNTFYFYVTPTTQTYNVVDYLALKFTGELGGGYRDKVTGILSPSRQFEQQSSFEETGVQIMAVQVTKEAIDDVLGGYASQDVQDMMDKGIFAQPAEWTYVG